MPQSVPVDLCSKAAALAGKIFGRRGAACVALPVVIAVTCWSSMQIAALAREISLLVQRFFHVQPPAELVVMISGLVVIAVAASVVKLFGRFGVQPVVAVGL